MAHEKLATLELLLQQQQQQQQQHPAATASDAAPQAAQPTDAAVSPAADPVAATEPGDSSAEPTVNLQQLQAALERDDELRRLRDDLEVALEQLRFAESENGALRSQLQAALSRPPQGRSASRSGTPVSGSVEKQLSELREQYDRVTVDLQQTQSQLSRALDEVTTLSVAFPFLV